MDTLELIENIRDGRDARDSQEQLYSKVREALLTRIERKITPRVRSRLDPEDVMHEAFLRGMGALDLFEPTSENAFFAWIFTIAKNVIIDQSKRRSVGAVHFVVSGDEKGPHASRIKADQRRPESLLLRREQIASLLRHLKEKEAEVIRLHRLDGLSYAQIG